MIIVFIVFPSHDTTLKNSFTEKTMNTIIIQYIEHLAKEQSEDLGLKGGNTDELYAGDGRKQMAESLQQQHPDVVSVGYYFNRWHHMVNYKPFKKNALKRKAGVVIPNRVNNYGMKIIDIGQ